MHSLYIEERKQIKCGFNVNNLKKVKESLHKI